MSRPFFSLIPLAFVLAGSAASSQLQPGNISGYQKISKTEGNLFAVLGANDQLGRSVTLLGDVDGDGIQDIAAGALSDDDGGTDRGAVYVMFLERDGTVKGQRKISDWFGNFQGTLDDGDQFGRTCCGLGDLDGDGIPDMAVGANFDDDGGGDRGAVWILFLNADGTVKGHQKISSTEGGFDSSLLNNFDEFGRSSTPLGDFDGDGVPDLAVGAPYDDDGDVNAGAIYMLMLNPDGTVKSQAKISQRTGNFSGLIGEKDYFGWSLAATDIDADGTLDLIVGEVLDDAGAINSGSIWVLFMNPDATVRSSSKINMQEGGFDGVLEDFDQFGVSVAAIGDLNQDQISEIAVGCGKFDDSAFETGAVFVLFMASDGSVVHQERIGKTGPVQLPLRSTDWFGSAMAPLGDLDLDGVPDLIVGSRNDDDGGANTGALYTLFLEGGILPPTARMHASTVVGEVPLLVSFEDASSGSPTTWAWDFGDGTTSSLQNPTHVYDLVGTYSVSLEVTGAAGIDQVTTTDWIVVTEPVVSSVDPLGCGANPPGSLTVLAGEPRIGTTLTFGVDNPYGTQNPGAIARLGVSMQPDALYPCGRNLPRLSMSRSGQDAEVLIDLTQLIAIATGEVWTGSGNPAAVSFDIEADTSLIGLSIYVQGLLIDKRATSGPRIGLAGGFEIKVGP